MKNKKVIRRPNISGDFTTVHHSILFDTRLSPTALRVLMVILSDADTFNVTQELLINRLKCNKKTIQLAFRNLEEVGYLKRKKLPKGHFYIVSEYGNLTSIVPEAGSSELDDFSEGCADTVLEVKSIVEPVIKPIILDDYANRIDALMPVYANTDMLLEVFSHFSKEIDTGRITCDSQMSDKKIKEVIALYVPTQSEAEKFVRSIALEHAGGPRMTIANQEKLVNEVVRYFMQMDFSLINEKAVKNRVLTCKSKYNSAGHLDQRYQN